MIYECVFTVSRLFLATVDDEYIGVSCFCQVLKSKDFIAYLVCKSTSDVHRMMISFLCIYLSECTDGVELQYFIYLYRKLWKYWLSKCLFIMWNISQLL